MLIKICYKKRYICNGIYFEEILLKRGEGAERKKGEGKIGKKVGKLGGKRKGG